MSIDAVYGIKGHITSPSTSKSYVKSLEQHETATLWQLEPRQFLHKDASLASDSESSSADIRRCQELPSYCQLAHSEIKLMDRPEGASATSRKGNCFDGDYDALPVTWSSAKEFARQILGRLVYQISCHLV